MKLSSILNLLRPSRDVPVPYEAGWRDDAELRKLARDSIKGITEWSLAGDLRELFACLACYNDGLPRKDHLRLEVTDECSRHVQFLREVNFYNRVRGWEDARDMEAMDCIYPAMGQGPENLIGLRLRVGQHFANAVYVNNVDETWLVIEQAGKERKRFYFHGDLHQNTMDVTKSGLKLL